MRFVRMQFRPPLPWPRQWIDARWRSALVGVIVVAALVAACGAADKLNISPAVASFFLGLALGLSVLLTRSRSTPTCTLCGATRWTRPALVSGISGAICDECVLVSGGVLIQDDSKRFGVLAVEHAVRALPEPRRTRVTSSLFALVQDLPLNAEERRRLASLAADARNFSAAIALLEAMPLENMKDEDRFMLAAALKYCRRPADALRVQNQIDLDGAPTPFHRALIVMNRVSMLCDLENSLTPERADRLLEDLATVHEVFRSQPYADAKVQHESERYLLGIEAMVLTKSGHAAKAKGLLESWLERHGELSADGWLELGHSRQALGDVAKARAAYEQALLRGHPDGEEVRIAREKLKS